jgi:hypothetical protein
VVLSNVTSKKQSLIINLVAGWLRASEVGGLVLLVVFDLLHTAQSTVKESVAIAL